MKVKNLVDKDEYREVTCSLTGGECSWGDCSTCEEGIEETHSEILREHNRLIPKTLSKKGDVVYSMNEYNTVAMFSSGRKVKDILAAFHLSDSNETPVRYDMSRLLIRWPEFVKIKYIMSLGIPLKLTEISNFLFAYYEDEFFVTAPRLTDEEFEESG